MALIELDVLDVNVPEAVLEDESDLVASDDEVPVTDEVPERDGEIEVLGDVVTEND